MKTFGSSSLGERDGLLVAVVDAGEHHVLDEDEPALGGVEAHAGGEHVGERVAVVDGHELRAQRRVGGVQREREADRHVGLREAVDAGDPADRRDRGAAVRDADVGQPPAGGEHVVEVHHRLAHAHEDGVVDGLDAAEVQRLVEDLRRRQVAAELHRARRAERAGQRAARLRGQAQRAAAVAIAHQTGLDRAPVGGVEERLDGAVAGVRLVDDRQRRVRHRAASRARSAAGRSVIAS